MTQIVILGRSSPTLDHYSIHPDTEQRGNFIVIWFGESEIVAGRKTHGIKTAQELKISIEAVLTGWAPGLINVLVLDVSRNGGR